MARSRRCERSEQSRELHQGVWVIVPVGQLLMNDIGTCTRNERVSIGDLFEIDLHTFRYWRSDRSCLGGLLVYRWWSYRIMKNVLVEGPWVMSQKFRPKEPVEASGIDVAKRIWTHWACGDYFWVLGTKYWVFGTSFGIWYLIWYLVPHPILGL